MLCLIVEIVQYSPIFEYSRPFSLQFYFPKYLFTLQYCTCTTLYPTCFVHIFFLLCFYFQLQHYCIFCFCFIYFCIIFFLCLNKRTVFSYYFFSTVSFKLSFKVYVSKHKPFGIRNPIQWC